MKSTVTVGTVELDVVEWEVRAIGTCLHCHRRGVRIKPRGLCSTCYGRHRHLYPRIRTQRPWTHGELILLAQHWRDPSLKPVMRQLDRTWAEVYKAGYRLGLPNRHPRWDDALLRRLVKLGYTTREIARMIKRHHNTVNFHMRKIGLAPNVTPQRFFAGVARRRKQALRRERESRERAGCYLRGWDGARTFAQADVLDALWERGPDTRHGLMTTLGLGDRTVRRLLRELLDLGLAVRIGHWDRRGVYALAVKRRKR